MLTPSHHHADSMLTNEKYCALAPYKKGILSYCRKRMSFFSFSRFFYHDTGKSAFTYIAETNNHHRIIRSLVADDPIRYQGATHALRA